MSADASPTPEAPLLLSVREAALAMRLCEKSIRNLVKSGELAAVRFGRALRLDPRDLQRLIEAKKGGGQ